MGTVLLRLNLPPLVGESYHMTDLNEIKPEQERTLDYDEYIYLCDLSGVSTNDRLTLEEWEQPFEGSADILLRSMGQRSVIPPIKDLAGFAAGRLAAEGIDALINGINTSLDDGTLDEKVKEFIRRRKEDIGKRNPFGKGKGGSGRGDGSGSGFNGPTPGGTSGGSPELITRQLSQNQRPCAINIDSGIKHNLYAKVRLDASTTSAPLHISTVRFGFPNDQSDPRFKSWWDINVTNKFQKLAQMRVGFNINSTTVFSSTNIYRYYEVICKGLQIYYSVLKPYLYSQNNRNDGVQFWRSNLAPQDLDYLMQLGNLLENEPIPPFLNAWMFQLYGVYYRSSMNPGSSLWALHPTTLGSTPSTTFKQITNNDTDIFGTIQDFTNPDYRKTSDMVARVFPEWRAENVFTTPALAEYSPNMNTLWANLPYINGANTNSTGPIVTGVTDEVPYNTYADSLDGLIEAHMSIYDSSNGALCPAFLTPVSNSFNNGSQFSSRLSFSNLSNPNISGMSWSGEFPELAYSRGETFVLVGNVASGFDKFGTESALGVTVNSVREVAYVALEKIVGLTAASTSATSPSIAVERGIKDANSPKKRRRRKGGKVSKASK